LPKVLPFSPIEVGQGGEALHLSIESFILGSLCSFNILFFCDGPIKLAHIKKKKRVELVRHPQLINMKQNKYPQYPRWAWFW
jgi:hypothetical protein